MARPLCHSVHHWSKCILFVRVRWYRSVWGLVNGRMLKHYYYWNSEIKVSTSIVNTISLFSFKEKGKIQKKGEKERFRQAQNLNLWSSKEWLKSAQNLSQRNWKAGSNMPKTWTSKERRRIISNKLKTRAEMKNKSDSNKLKIWVTRERRMI